MLETMLLDAIKEQKKVFWRQPLRLQASASEISACFLASGQTVLVYGADFFGLDSALVQKELVGNFMRIVSPPKPGSPSEGHQMVRTQFEQIQKLNNELLNTQRQLKKANAQLNQLNRDLNSRLVKDPLTAKARMLAGALNPNPIWKGTDDR
ncbi:hypothetical protein [Anaerotalea alkaliphila]|uniref:Uncharacterized protein n=1 Tax=Anaerotalea alkaliphila TaxID=2662126 RepID=A0A7X5HUX2_9FIRM|nr:hypothetical protein [Anaerotalea alkaliphila]NDL67107.1 hypothetical protein [Anaerotalea alkaliphila]